MNHPAAKTLVQRVSGLDGCRAGWIAFFADLQPGVHQLWDCHSLGWVLLQDHDDLLQTIQSSMHVWIDIPIGLPSSTDPNAPKRGCDGAVREALGSKRSSIFTPPIRDVLDIHEYHSAMKLQYESIGVKCSIQAWNLTPKIRQIDAIWDQIEHPLERLHESHPELQFQCWANQGDTSMLASKKTVEGQRQRIDLLDSQGFHDAALHYENCLSQTLRKHVQPDDILDAMALVWGCVQAMNGFGSVFPEGEIPLDSKGRPMAIHFARPK